MSKVAQDSLYITLQYLRTVEKQNKYASLPGIKILGTHHSDHQYSTGGYSPAEARLHQGICCTLLTPTGRP